MSELKPCPFCGSDNLSIRRNMQLDGMTFIVCEPCGAVTSFHGNEQKQNTIDLYNTRIPEPEGE